MFLQVLKSEAKLIVLENASRKIDCRNAEQNQFFIIFMIKNVLIDCVSITKAKCL